MHIDTRFRYMKKRNAQIWVETVLYTLIGLALIGIILAIVTPKINQAKDKTLVEQTIGSLGSWDEKIRELVDKGAGNVRNIPVFTMKRGSLIINSSSDEIIFVVDGLSKPYSEIGYPIREGNIVITSYQDKKTSYVELVLDYSNVANITYEGEDQIKKFTAATTAYSFSIKNLGGEDFTQVDIEETSRG
jgi:hypothetical protein